MKNPSFIILSSILLASCSSPLGQDALGDLRQQTSSRLGKNTAVPSSPEETARGQRRVSSLLKRPLNSESAVEIALLNNRQIRATLEEVGISQAEVVAAATWSNPTLATSIRFPGGGGRADSDFGIAADILNWILAPQRAKIAYRELEQTKRRVSHEILVLAAETKGAFYSLQTQQQMVQKLQAMVESSGTVADLSKRMHDAGNINDLELLTSQTGVTQAQLDIKRANTEIAAARAKLNRFMGLSESDGSWTVTTTPLTLPAHDPSLSSVKKIALQQRQDLAAAVERVTIVEQALKLKLGTRYLPGVNLGVDTERGTDGQHVTGPTLDLELPLFDRGKADVSKLEAELRQARSSYEGLRAEVINDVETAHAALVSTRDVTSHLDGVLVPQRQKILKETLLHYNAMQKSSFELLFAKQEEQRAEKESSESLRAYWMARAELEKAAGGSLAYKPVPSSK